MGAKPAESPGNQGGGSGAPLQSEFGCSACGCQGQAPHRELPDADHAEISRIRWAASVFAKRRSSAPSEP